MRTTQLERIGCACAMSTRRNAHGNNFATATGMNPTTPSKTFQSSMQPTGVLGLRALLSTDHAALEVTFDHLLEACRSNAREDIADTWKRFEGGLRRHMAFEEELFFPILRRVHPDEVEQLAAEHGQIRQWLTDMAVEVDLHCLRLMRVDNFVALLRRHAQREDALMYRWAEMDLPEPMRTTAVTRVRQLLSWRG